MYGQRISDFVQKNQIKVIAVATVGFFYFPGFSPFIFTYERLLLKSRIQLGLFVPEDEKFRKGKFMETSSTKLLRNVIAPEVHSEYYIVAGGFGIGKSSAVTHIADELGHQGIVYIQVPKDGDPMEFERCLARKLFLYHLIHSKLQYLSSIFGAILLDYPPENIRSYLTQIMKNLRVLSGQFKKWHDGKSLVLVIDEVDNFLEEDATGKNNAAYLHTLQNIAKGATVSNTLFSSFDKISSFE